MRAAPALVLATLFATTHLPPAPLSIGDDAAAARASMAANILIVKSHAEIANWVTLDPAKRGGNTGRMRLVTRGPKIYLPLVATFADSQVGRRIALRGALQIVSPHGRTANFRCFANQMDPRAPKTIVLEPVMDITFDPTDPNGD